MLLLPPMDPGRGRASRPLTQRRHRPTARRNRRIRPLHLRIRLSNPAIRLRNPVIRLHNPAIRLHNPAIRLRLVTRLRHRIRAARFRHPTSKVHSSLMVVGISHRRVSPERPVELRRI
jgi:hypothetical protein